MRCISHTCMSECQTASSALGRITHSSASGHITHSSTPSRITHTHTSNPRSIAPSLFILTFPGTCVHTNLQAFCFLKNNFCFTAKLPCKQNNSGYRPQVAKRYFLIPSGEYTFLEGHIFVKIPRHNIPVDAVPTPSSQSLPL